MKAHMRITSQEHKARMTKSFLVAGSVVIIFIAFLTLGAELVAPLKTWLARAFSHHWLGKSILSLLIFGVLAGAGYVLPGNTDDAALNRWVRALAWCSALGAVVVYGFFTLEWFHVL